MIQDTEEYIEETLSLDGKRKELIKKALSKYSGKRKYAARNLAFQSVPCIGKLKNTI
jgi:hypothetical protein